jgi:hypothetical protein
MALFNSPTSAGSLLQPTSSVILPNFLVMWAYASSALEKEKAKIIIIKANNAIGNNAILVCNIQIESAHSLLYSLGVVR